MQKKNKFICFFDNFFWFIVKILPVLVLLLLSINNGSTNITDIMSNYFGITNNNFIMVALLDLFGSSSEFLPIFSNTGILSYMCYYITVTLLHIVVDFIKLLPDLLHGFIEKIDGGCD